MIFSTRSAIDFVSLAGRFARLLWPAAIVLLAGCTDREQHAPVPAPPANPPAESRNQIKAQPQEPTVAQSRQGELEQLLKQALDSWQFGDSLERFQKHHPNVKIVSPDWTTNAKLMKYELGPSRVRASFYEFSVVLIFESKIGNEIKIKKNCTFHQFEKDVWTLSIL